MAAQEWESAPLQPVLRLIHCIQKERGASCALVGSLAQPTPEEHPFGANLRAARIASNSAISSLYRSVLWRNFCEGNEDSDLELATMLFRVRELVDGGAGDENEYLFFHVVIVEYNSFLSSVIQVFVVKGVAKRKRDIQMKINAPKMLDGARRNAKVALSLLDLILSFVTLKESMGMERATLSGLMANSVNEINDENANIEVVAVQKSKHGARLNLIVNDLVMVVESQHQIMRDLQKQSGLNICGSLSSSKGGTEIDELLSDEHFCTLLRLVGDSVRQSDAMLSLQEHFRTDFDIEGFQQAMSMEDFWTGITLYMDQLHSMELFLLEELENCEGGSEDLDLMSLGRRQPSPSTLLFDGISQQGAIETVSKMTQEELKETLVSYLTQKACKSSELPVSPDRSNKEKTAQSPSHARSKSSERPALEEWEISLYEVEFLRRIGRGSAGTTYLGKYANQDVAVKVAATSKMGLEGWKAELMSLKKMHHTNIIRFMGAIYHEAPVTYCLVLEYCHGGDLSVALAGNTPPKFFTNVTSGIASGLYYLHNKKYMHRDIKPSNVLISGDLKSGQFTAKLTDFGLAVKMQNDSVSNDKDLTAETGTYRYMAPEVIRHECYNYAADVYSFGLLMWEIITREKPFEPLSQIEAAGSVALEGKRPPFPNDIPFTVKTLIEKCWADKPDERMEVELIIKCLDDLGNNMVAESWLAAPSGHPVYKKDVQEKTQHGTAMSSIKVQQKKKKSFLTSASFRMKKK